MASLNVGNLGDYLREQRRTAQLSLRQLAEAAGVSNPYLSQIERGLRKPSAEVLQQVAKALRISAETLYVRAGILDAERDRDEVETRAVILADPTLNERQKQVLLQIYESFRKENGFGTGDDSDVSGVPDGSGGAGIVGVVADDGAVSVDGDASDAGTEIPRPGQADGGQPARRRSRKSVSKSDSTSDITNDGGTTATRRTRKGTGASDTDPQQTAG
ncbi:helix-turn-helix transcriptional regulator [Streptomyces sp. D2-8]|uniref:helix-turn-helix domain-containing protein n=1 Tax=Streptomyces sp. D2-8 TaxID=2707767 RepID=UPI0020C0B7D0|nr:helix-turn-helix transcriptional regulator [Streptomyces sp. D2-8]MCK8438440.1 helix-turn-helix transcriptional regulator [Streptomyces sp. D2-8]